MEKPATELSGRTPAFVTWMQTIGLVLFIISRFFLREHSWALYVASFFLIGAYCLRLYFDWKHGRKKAFRNGLIILAVAILLGLIVAYIASQKG